MIEYGKSFDDDSTLFFVIHPENDPAQKQVQFCHNLIEILFEKRNNRCKQEMQTRKHKSIKRQSFDHYIKSVCNITPPHATEYSQLILYHYNQNKNQTKYKQMGQI